MSEVEPRKGRLVSIRYIRMRYRVLKLVGLCPARDADRGQVDREYPGNPREVSGTGTSRVVSGSGYGSRKRRFVLRKGG